MDGDLGLAPDKYVCRLGLSMILLKASMLERKEKEKNCKDLEMRDLEKTR